MLTRPTVEIIYFTICTNIESSGCTPETNIILYISYITIKHLKTLKVKSKAACLSSGAKPKVLNKFWENCTRLLTHTGTSASPRPLPLSPRAVPHLSGNAARSTRKLSGILHAFSFSLLCLTSGWYRSPCSWAVIWRSRCNEI